MKTDETKQEFIILRAAGHSYAAISKKLHISKGTCSAWEHDMAQEIATLKAVELDALYETYGMQKAAKIKQLGTTLDAIQDALKKADFSEVPPERLLDYQLKYMDALQREYIDTDAATMPPDAGIYEIVAAYTDLLNRVRAGTVTTTAAAKEIVILANLLKAYDAVDLQEKIETLEMAVGR